MKTTFAIWGLMCAALVGCGNSSGSNADATDTVEGTDAAGLDDTDAVGAGDTSIFDQISNETISPGCVCGDGKCDAPCQETLATCAKDCAVCGDGTCSPGESPEACKVDCCGSCGDGKCVGGPCMENIETCAADCNAKACGDGACGADESPLNCPTDCEAHTCGNHVCEAGESGPDGCPDDCGGHCGNCACEDGETWGNCPQDCGYCGDGVCSACSGLGETAKTCQADCKSTSCSDGGVSCDDGVACTVDKCETTGACSHTADATACADNEACTQDKCDLVAGCTHLSGDGPCDDGSACTYNDQCLAGVCKGVDGCTDGGTLTGGGDTGGSCNQMLASCKIQPAGSIYDETFTVACASGNPITIQVNGPAGQTGNTGKNGGPCQPGEPGGQGTPGKFPDLKALACTDCVVTDLDAYTRLVTCGTSTRQVLRGPDGANGLNGANGNPPPGSPNCP